MSDSVSLSLSRCLSVSRVQACRVADLASCATGVLKALDSGSTLAAAAVAGVAKQDPRRSLMTKKSSKKVVKGAPPAEPQGVEMDVAGPCFPVVYGIPDVQIK